MPPRVHAGPRSGLRRVGPERILPAQQFTFTSDPNNDGRASNDNTYAIGDEVLVQVTFSTDVTVPGSTRLELNVGGGDGKPASYSGRSWRLMVPWLVRSAGESTLTGTGDVVTVRGCPGSRQPLFPW